MERPADQADEPVIIEPIDFRSASSAPRRRQSLRRTLMLILWSALILTLAVTGWFVLTARHVRITVEPAPDRVDVDGGLLRFRLGEHHLLRRGAYELHATLEGYHPLHEPFEVTPDGADELRFVLRELPGIVTLHCVGADDPAAALAGVEVAVDGEAIGPTPLAAVELETGAHVVRLERDRYVALETEIAVEGRGRSQVVTLELRPDWAEVTLETVPAGAEVLIDGQPAGRTPAMLELRSGTRAIELRAEGHEPWHRDVEIVAEQPLTLAGIVLEPARGRLLVETVPPGAQVMVEGDYAGTTPIEVAAAPQRDLLVQVAQDGFEPASRTVRLEPGETATVAFELTAQLGTVHLAVAPADATLVVDGDAWGSVPSEIELPARAHQLEFRRDGYEPQTRTIRPRPDVPQRITVQLRPVRREAEPGASVARAANGSELVLIRPAAFTMGASRREQGRRSNETQRSIELTRPFYVGAREVTNAEFDGFRPGHASGEHAGLSLDGADRPVVQVTWDDATRFCNWLSAQDDLPPAYVERQGAMRAVEPMTVGYRLPTEAEWEYVARMTGPKRGVRFPWGDDYPPPKPSGNFADASASGVLNIRVPGYDDGFAGPAPVGSFEANGFGLHDLGGNVTEWCHDFYTMYTYDPGSVDVDPTGPAEGRHHVVRGSSWRDSSISDLRCAHRDYDDGTRDDLGFRIARYLTSAEQSE